VRYGICVLPGDVTWNPVELARATEAAGFESLVFAEHSHIPIRRPAAETTDAERTYLAATSAAWGQTEDESLRQYAGIPDPIVYATAAGVSTTELVVGTAVLLPVEHDPIALAQQLATLDVVTGGRLFLGVGGGWNRAELRDHGVDPAERWSILRETILAMRSLWTEPEPEFHGTHIEIGPCLFEPKPVSQPHPPILLGGSGPRVRALALEVGDGWIPTGPRQSADQLVRMISEFQEDAAAAGRGRMPVTIYAGAVVNAAEADALAGVGVERIILPVRPMMAAPWADQLSALAQRVSEVT
jgi:probable F420-dependent oxidoreductase